MGRSTEAAVVPFVVNDNSLLPSQIKEAREDDNIWSLDYNGWHCDWGSTVEYHDSNRNCLYSNIVATKAPYTVYLINEAQYSNGGEEDYCAFSETQDALIAFCNDWGINSKIRANDVVSQTM